jgi:hypothetical protein
LPFKKRIKISFKHSYIIYFVDNTVIGKLLYPIYKVKFLILDLKQLVRRAKRLKTVKNIAIFDSSAEGVRLLKKCTDLGITVRFFIDNSPENEQDMIMGIPIYQLEYAIKNKISDIDGVLLVSDNKKYKMIKSLQSLDLEHLIL